MNVSLAPLKLMAIAFIVICTITFALGQLSAATSEGPIIGLLTLALLAGVTIGFGRRYYRKHSAKIREYLDI